MTFPEQRHETVAQRLKSTDGQVAQAAARVIMQAWNPQDQQNGALIAVMNSRSNVSSPAAGLLAEFAVELIEQNEPKNWPGSGYREIRDSGFDLLGFLLANEDPTISVGAYEKLHIYISGGELLSPLEQNLAIWLTNQDLTSSDNTGVWAMLRDTMTSLKFSHKTEAAYQALQRHGQHCPHPAILTCVDADIADYQLAAARTGVYREFTYVDEL